MENNQEENIDFKYDVARATFLVEPPPPPPRHGFTSPFKTIQEWLFHLCDTNRPQKPISEYHFTLIERPSNNLICLEGFNTYDIDNNIIAHHIDFKPSTHMFFALPEEQFGTLTQQQVREQVLNEIIEFTKTVKFQNSFLSQGNSIKMGLAGAIWTK